MRVPSAEANVLDLVQRFNGWARQWARDAHQLTAEGDYGEAIYCVERAEQRLEWVREELYVLERMRLEARKAARS